MFYCVFIFFLPSDGTTLWLFDSSRGKLLAWLFNARHTRAASWVTGPSLQSRGRVIGIQDHLDDRGGWRIPWDAAPCLLSCVAKFPKIPHPPFAQREWEINTERGRGERKILFCMQWVGSSIPEGDIVGEGETAFYAWGEISFRFVLQLTPPTPPHAYVCRDLWPVTSEAHRNGRCREERA